MTEREFKITPVGVEYVCDKCGSGTMQQAGQMLMCDPPKWQHKCSHCGDTAALSENYPTVRYKRSRCCDGGPQWGHSLNCPSLP